MSNISGTRRHEPVVSFVPSNDIKCAVNEPLTKENDGELMKIEYTLLLKHSMTDICKI